MFNLGPLELVAIFVVALLVFGPEKLPEMGKQVGRAVKEFRKFQATMQTQVRDVIEPITGPMMPNNGPLPQPGPTNIRGTIPTEVPATPNVAAIGDGAESRTGRRGRGRRARNVRALRPGRTALQRGLGGSRQAEATPPPGSADPDSR